MSFPITLFLPILLALLLLPVARSHAVMWEPNQRGALPKAKFVMKAADNNAPLDPYRHFPAGDKIARPGAGLNSQRRAAGSAGWTPFTPLNPNFRWRADVCGDPIGRRAEHLRGGRYYYGGKIVKTYKQGGIVDVSMSVIAHHNGFIEMHLCNIAKCGGEVSQDCFRKGHCMQLKRAKMKECESGMSKKCGPIDRNYPGRWYMPCSKVLGKDGWETMGPHSVMFQLPEKLTCKHCVLQWFWTAANSCNPPGVVAYFDGPDRPKTWGTCRGQAGAQGGVARNRKPCSKNLFPEEYLQCADISITPRNGGDNDSGMMDYAPKPVKSMVKGTSSAPKITMQPSLPTEMPPKSTVMPTVKPMPRKSMMSKKRRKGRGRGRGRKRRNGGRMVEKVAGVIQRLVLVADGKIVSTIQDGSVINVSKYGQIAIEAITSRKVSRVEFSIDGRKVWTDFNMPYFMFGNRDRVPNYWRNPIVNRRFSLMVEADGDSVKAMILFSK